MVAAMTKPVLVCGATGQVGGCLRAALDEAGVPWIGLSRRPPTDAPGQWRQADFGQPGSLGPALEGVETVFLACGDRPDQGALEVAVIDACKQRGVGRVVKLSAHSAGLVPPVSFGVMHAQAEQALRASGMAWAVVRPVFFMQSLLLFAEAIAGGKLIAATGAGEVAFVDVRDVAAVAAAVIADPGLAGVHTLTGGRALSFGALAELLSIVVGRPVRHISPPRWLARVVLPWVAGMPRWQSNLVVELMGALAAGAQSTPTRTIKEILGREPRTIEEFLADQRAAFRGRVAR
jgi:uncharacterized protein YbjT (DUF2867 family)